MNNSLVPKQLFNVAHTEKQEERATLKSWEAGNGPGDDEAR